MGWSDIPCPVPLVTVKLLHVVSVLRELGLILSWSLRCNDLDLPLWWHVAVLYHRLLVPTQYQQSPFSLLPYCLFVPTHCHARLLLTTFLIMCGWESGECRPSTITLPLHRSDQHCERGEYNYKQRNINTFM